ncbi:uncharacterized protein LOC111710830 isoform X2 [Eurytemora carolleeae]|uniref:uncharacterized protein LOC111710830 isoform X2 n=1 Tax=Eurytemora carolleeae TaxID=1294199 RepID=UPI000C784F37|nr:uncharacterized protein LOC111710830 isoform X2 [Eurytemora carolleeae]|eukprot:XP_023340751.1 uncharacterized protein LOC111710830 isoform X2 [Eurytemora affinis]
MSKPCRFYLQGYCKNGRYCRFNHQSVTRDQRGLATKTITNTRNGEWERKQEYEKHTGSQRNLIERSRDYENRAGMGERRRTQADSERNKERTASYEATKLSKIEERSMKGSDERLGKERSGKLNLQEPVKERETWRVREDRKHWGNERGVNNSVEHVSRDDVSKQRNIPLNDTIHPGYKQLRSTEKGEGAETKTAKEPENPSSPHKPVIQQDNKYSSSDNSENSKTKSGKINCICLYHTFDPEMLRCSSCGNFSHKTCYNSNLKSTHQCVCLIKEGVKCGNPEIDNHFSNKSRSIEENLAFVFNLNRKRVLKSILNQEFLTCQPGSDPSIEFLKIRFGYSTDYASP